ncbi:hypothetical protein CYMTET_6452 [Cymbomonas tetramitiformis]|uniref:Uncharacterized protein n=1 Tax=Cymbomonas tetramitiformis TaxID=36881 RepID=A0AAE0LIE1_9CHLO|nr:hypothetical protein CYMTET_6452 [Cymbomonas tetramitiformis]
MAQAYIVAFEEQDGEWASKGNIQSYMHDAIMYQAPDGSVYHGRIEVTAKLNSALAAMMEGPQASALASNSDMIKKLAGNAKMKITGPTPSDSGTWLMVYSLNMVMVKIKVTDEFSVDADGKIVKLIRTR